MMAITGVLHPVVAAPPAGSAPTLVQHMPFVGSGGITNMTFAAASAGHLLTAIISASQSRTVTPPSGWALVGSGKSGTGSSDVGVWVYQKVASGGETSASFNSQTGACSGEFLEFSGVNAMTPITQIQFATATSYTATLPSLTPTTANNMAVGAAFWYSPRSVASSASTGWTLVDSVIANNYGGGAMSQAQDDSLAQITGSMGMTNGGAGVAVHFLVAP